MKEVKGKLCFGYEKEEKIPFCVRFEVHQEDCPHQDEPLIQDEVLFDYVACLTLGSGKEDKLVPLCPYAEKINYNVDMGEYTCLCKCSGFSIKERKKNSFISFMPYFLRSMKMIFNKITCIPKV